MNNLELMKKRLYYQGGNQEQRMIKDKYDTFKKALLYSYQSADIKRDNETETYKALINPDKLKPDYDDKILSVDFKYNYQPGDIFYWVGTNTHWLVYLRQLTEDAYFRAEIRRCKYQLQWINEFEQEINTWAYIRGPVETKVNFIQKLGISVDTPNWTLDIYIPATEENKKKFHDRYEKFYFDHKCWEIQVVDSVSIDGVLQIEAMEYYNNRTLDNPEENLDGYFQVVPVIPEPDKEIIGPNFVKPTIPTIFKAWVDGGTWSIKEENRPVILEPCNKNEVKITWEKYLSGQFTLQYSVNDKTYEKVIVAESLF